MQRSWKSRNPLSLSRRGVGWPAGQSRYYDARAAFSIAACATTSASGCYCSLETGMERFRVAWFVARKTLHTAIAACSSAASCASAATP